MRLPGRNSVVPLPAMTGLMTKFSLSTRPCSSRVWAKAVAVDHQVPVPLLLELARRGDGLPGMIVVLFQSAAVRVEEKTYLRIS